MSNFMNLSWTAPDDAFEYIVRVQPHHTDYAGVVWHGSYVAWLEEARVEYLRSRNIAFANWVKEGVDLPVVDLALRYRQPLTLGMEAAVKCWLMPRQGIKIVWQYDIQNRATGTSYVLAQVTLVPVSRTSQKILRQLPEPVQSELAQLFGSSRSPFETPAR